MKARVLSETGQWFLARREFTDWIGSDQSSLLWLRGNGMLLLASSINIELLVTELPSGNWKDKSNVSQHFQLLNMPLFIDFTASSCVIEKFLAKPCLDSEEALAYFYCSRTSSDTRQQNPRAILLSILRQLAAPLPGLPLKSPIISAYDKETIRGSQEAHLPISEIIVLLTELIQNHYKNVTLIIDALDECDVSGRSCLLDAFAKLTYNPITTVKTLVSSRNDPDIENHFSKIPSLSITATDNADDILKFVHKEISQRLLRGRASKQLRELVENDLNYKANGVFRWVALQVDALCDPDRVYSMEDVEYLLPRLPKTLEDTYTRILDDLEGLPPPSRKAIKNLFKLLICAEYPMSIQQLLAALAILSASPRVAWDKALILKMARGLITLELEGQSLIFAHLSVKESLEKREEFCGESAHAVAAEACLKTYLRTNSIVDQFPYFQWYAVTHLGRHCLKSGRMRQEPKLQNLMKEFLLAEDSNDAFERWNRDCFLTDVETAPGTCSERRSCQSHPGLPLFMVCVYGFDEFVESTIGNRDHVFSAENFLKQRPLEVATWYNNFNTMVKIYNAASLTHKRSIQTKRWLEAASMSGNLDVWNFAMMHVPDIPFKSVVVSAAKNLVHGKEMVSSLLNRATDIDEEILAEILRGCSSFEILDMILKYTSPVKFTEPMMEAAVQNPFINPELTEMILSNHQDLRVSETCILSAVLEAYESHSKESVIKALLNHPTRCEVTEEMIYILACFCKSEDVECLGLLLQYCVVDHITEDWLVAAAANPSTGPVILEFFLNHASGNEISQQVLQGAILNRWEAGNRLTALLSRPGCPPVLEESLYIMTETSGDDMVLSTAMEACESMHITDAYLKACAANRSRNELSQVIILPRAVPISMDAVYASTTNFPNAPAVLQFLLRIKSGFDLEESEDLFYQALSNLTEALALAHILADLWKNLPVTERSMMAAVRNHRHGTNTFKFLLQYCACVEEMFTENVLQAAIEGDNIEFVEYFKQKRPNFEVKEESLKAAINGYSTNNAILRILLSQEARCAISSSVLETAARTGNQTTLELLLEQPDASDLPSDILDLTKRKPPGVETDDTTTFEVILSAASKEGMPGEYSYELSTSKLDPLLSKYIGPAVDSGRLVEVAAERGDGKFVVQYLLSRFPETLVTRHALLAAASNEVATTSLLGLLLKHSHADVDLKLLQLAAGNKYRGTQMIELLLANRPADAKIERAVLIAAMGNPYCGRSLLKLFLVRQPDLAVTQDLVDTASENSVLGKILLQMLLKQALTLCSTISANSVLEKFKSIKDGLRDSLFMAACYGDDKILRFLMSHNVSLSSISGELGTALNVAAHAGNLNVVEILLDEGSDPESLSKLYGTPLQSACQQRNLQIVRALARHGVEIDRPNQIGRTELHIAIRNGDYEIVDALISFGASTTKRDHQGMSAMHHASLHTVSADCVNLLIKSGAPVDAEDSHQWSPLHWAAKSGAVDTVRRLLVAGVMKTKTDASGKTPFQIAMLCGNIHLRPQLLACGVSVSALDTELAGEVHQKIVCDICDLVSLNERTASTQAPFLALIMTFN